MNIPYAMAELTQSPAVAIYSLGAQIALSQLDDLIGILKVRSSVSFVCWVTDELCVD